MGLISKHVRVAGTGDVFVRDDDELAPSVSPGSYLWNENALNVFGKKSGRPLPTREEFVAWPNAGYFPAVFSSQWWSFSLDKADFSQTEITVMRDGQPIEVVKQEPKEGFGLNTVVWSMPDVDTTKRIQRDVVFDVQIRNVKKNTESRDFHYQVTAIPVAL